LKLPRATSSPSQAVAFYPGWHLIRRSFVGAADAAAVVLGFQDLAESHEAIAAGCALVPEAYFDEVSAER
jgi:hypothetical protein